MTTPQEESTPQDPQRPAPEDGPQVTTAPPRSRWRPGPVPSHLGRARTSTVVLAALFIGVFVLWVYVRPEPAQTATTGGDTAVVTTPTRATTRAPATTTAAPRTSTAPPTSTSPAQSTTAESTAATTTPATTTAATPTRVQATATSAPAATTGAAGTTATPTG